MLGQRARPRSHPSVAGFTESSPHHENPPDPPVPCKSCWATPQPCPSSSPALPFVSQALAPASPQDADGKHGVGGDRGYLPCSLTSPVPSHLLQTSRKNPAAKPEEKKIVPLLQPGTWASSPGRGGWGRTPGVRRSPQPPLRHGPNTMRYFKIISALMNCRVVRDCS